MLPFLRRFATTAAILHLLVVALADSTLRKMFTSSEAFGLLPFPQQECSAGDSLHGAVASSSPCKIKDCFCADPQFISDATERCTINLHEFNGLEKYKNMYTAETYNGIMSFFANECGTFKVQTKVLRAALYCLWCQMTDNTRHSRSRLKRSNTLPCKRLVLEVHSRL